MGQVQLKLGDLRSSLANFEKVLEVHPESCEAVKVSWYLIVYFVETDYCQHFITIKKLDNYYGHCFMFWLLSTFCFCYLNSLSFFFWRLLHTFMCSLARQRRFRNIWRKPQKLILVIPRYFYVYNASKKMPVTLWMTKQVQANEPNLH